MISVLGTEFTSGATASALVTGVATSVVTATGVATAVCTVLSAVASSELLSDEAGRALLVEVGKRAFPMS